MNRTSSLVGVFIAASLALTACGASAHNTPAATPAATPTPSTASAIQYASGLNGPIKSYQAAWKNYEGDCPLGDPGAMCSIELTTVSFAALTIGVTIQGLSSESSNSYIGPPPATLQSLVDQTSAIANTVGTQTSHTTDLPDGWYQNAVLLDSDCDAWGPYLNA